MYNLCRRKAHVARKKKSNVHAQLRYTLHTQAKRSLHSCQLGEEDLMTTQLEEKTGYAETKKDKGCKEKMKWPTRAIDLKQRKPKGGE